MVRIKKEHDQLDKERTANTRPVGTWLEHAHRRLMEPLQGRMGQRVGHMKQTETMVALNILKMTKHYRRHGGH